MFKRIEIPLTAGLRNDTADLDVPTPGLSISENVIYGRAGAVVPRPSLVSENGSQITHGATDSTDVGDLSLDLNERIGLCGDGDRVLLLEASQLLTKRNGTWDQAGPCWSVFTRSDDLVGDTSATVPGSDNFTPHVGKEITAYPTASPVGNYSTPAGLPAAVGPEVQRWKLNNSRCAVNEALFLTDGASVYMLSGYPTETTVLLASDALVSGAVQSPQRLWATYRAVDNAYYVAYQRAADVRILRVTSAGSVTGFVDITKGQTASGNVNLCLALGTDELENALVLAVTGVNDTLATYRFALPALTDSGHDASVSVGGAEVLKGPVVGFVQGVSAFVAAYSDKSGSVRVWRRDATATATSLTAHTRFYGTERALVASNLTFWRTWFAPRLFHGRVVMGVYHAVHRDFPFERQPATWVVVDISSQDRKFFVACGEEQATLLSPCPSSSELDGSGRLVTTHLAAINYTAGFASGVLLARASRLTHELAPAQTATANGVTFVSGQVSYAFDGRRSVEALWPLTPNVQAVSDLSGTLVGTQTFTGVWTSVDAQGNTTRSAPAFRHTIQRYSTDTLTLNIEVPQITARSNNSVVLQVFGTGINPIPNAPLTLINTVTVQTVTTFNAATQVYLQSTLPNGEPVYTNGGILASERPLANCGIVAVGSRVWCADERQAYASKLVRAGETPSWAISDDSLTLTVPSGAGRIRGLGGIDNLLVILCENAVCVFTGSGPGDTGGPSDFVEPRMVYRASGPAFPGDVCLTRDSVVWASATGDAHMFSQGAQGQALSRPVGALKLRRPVFSPGAQQVHDLLTFMATTEDGNALAVLDTEQGQWGLWLTHEPPLDIHGSANGVRALFAAAPYVGTYSGDATQDAGAATAFTTRIRTKLTPLGHLGRVKSVTPLGKRNNTGVSTQMTVRVYLDREEVLLPENEHVFTITTPTDPEDWPRDELPEFRLGVQRAEAFSVEIVCSVPVIELKAIQARVKAEPDNIRRTRG